MEKKGVSAIFAVAILIILAFVAIGLLWALLSPNLKASIKLNEVKKAGDIGINSLAGYTCYDSAQGVFAVQVKKGSGEFNLTSIKFYLYYSGNSLYYQKDYSMSANSERIFFLNSSTLANVEKISVVPVFYEGTKEVDGKQVSLNKFDYCTLVDLENEEILQPLTRTPLVNPYNRPGVFLMAPSQASSVNNSYMNFIFKVNNTVEFCKLYLDGSLKVTNSTINKNVNVSNNLTSLSPGSHTWLVSCNYSEGQVNSSTQTFEINALSLFFNFNYSSEVFSKLRVQTIVPVTYNNFSILSMSEIDQPGSSVRLFYDFESNNTTHVFDLNSHQTNSHGIFSGGAAISSQGALSGKSLVLDGVNDYVQINSGTSSFNEGQDAILDAFDNNFSISIWVKPGRNSSNIQFIFQANEFHADGSCTNTGYIGFYTFAGKMFFEFRQYTSNCGSFTGSLNYPFTLDNSSWSYVTLTRQVVNSSFAYQKIYLNGQLVNTSISDQGQDLRLWSHYHLGAAGDHTGSAPYHTGFFNGSIDNFIIFKRTLNSTEVSELYNNQSKLFNATGIITYANQTISSQTNYTELTFNVTRNSSTTVQARVGYGNSSNILGYTSWAELNSTSGISFALPGGNTILTPELRLTSDAYQFYSPRVY